MKRKGNCGSERQVSCLREQVVCLSRRLDTLRLNRGTSGNCSIRSERGFLVTPSGVNITDLSVAAIVEMDLSGEVLSSGAPSSEWRFHKDIMSARTEVNVIIHTHSTYAAALSCFRKDIPAFHYMIAAAGGNSIRCSDYALFGSQALSDNVLQALEGRRACLMSNHGMIVTGKTVQDALALAIEVESLSEQYLLTLQAGQPVLLTEEEMADVLKQFVGYGNWSLPETS
jgi:L-fuculose-phosphate aldolase